MRGAEHLLVVSHEDAGVELHDDQERCQGRAQLLYLLPVQALALRLEQALQQLQIIFQHVHIIRYEPPASSADNAGEHEGIQHEHRLDAALMWHYPSSMPTSSNALHLRDLPGRQMSIMVHHFGLICMKNCKECDKEAQVRTAGMRLHASIQVKDGVRGHAWDSEQSNSRA